MGRSLEIGFLETICKVKQSFVGLITPRFRIFFFFGWWKIYYWAISGRHSYIQTSGEFSKLWNTLRSHNNQWNPLKRGYSIPRHKRLIWAFNFKHPMLEVLRCRNYGKLHREDIRVYKYINDHTKTIAVNIGLPLFIFSRNIAESNSEELNCKMWERMKTPVFANKWPKSV